MLTRHISPSTARWAKPRHELLLLALCAVAALSTVNLINVQDQSRFCLTDALAHGRLTVDRCIGSTGDRARYAGHLYSNKAPGMSLLALPAALVVGYAPTSELHQYVGARLWLVRLFACGLPFLLAAFLVGRVCEGISPGTGGPALVTFAVGTAAAPFAVVGFDHLPTAAFGFAAFVLAWRRRPLAAGLAAGAALLCEYEAAAIVGIVGLYVALLGARSLWRYALGVLPGAALLGAYDFAAFGAPWRTPLPYSDNEYRAVHSTGLLGVHLPNLDSTWLVLAGSGGLLLTSPVLIMAAIGLVMVWRKEMRAEALVCACVSLVFVGAECGYGDPYGGYSPVPRYLIPALPFLCMGFACAFNRLRASTTLFAAMSIAATMTLALTWTVGFGFQHGVWGAVFSVVSDANGSWRTGHLAPNAFTWLGANAAVAGAGAWLAGFAALTVALRHSATAPPTTD
ncbi:MAG: hypothetical protein QOF43_1046 [Gaiellaceae bacterium]|nr:hypothetical protein [Gaiellaceae bacterium]